MASSTAWPEAKCVGIGNLVVSPFEKGAAYVLVANKGGPLLVFAELLAV